MFVPPYDSLLKKLNTSRAAVEASGEITIPTALLRFLLQIALGISEFDENAYLRANPDVRAAVRNGEVDDGAFHYIGFGYFEGRKGAIPIDERWYLQKYPDVAGAVKEGTTSSAADHFHSIGAAEGRSPSAEQEQFARQWKVALFDE